MSRFIGLSAYYDDLLDDADGYAPSIQEITAEKIRRIRTANPARPTMAQRFPNSAKADFPAHVTLWVMGDERRKAN